MGGEVKKRAAVIWVPPADKLECSGALIDLVVSGLDTCPMATALSAPDLAPMQWHMPSPRRAQGPGRHQQPKCTAALRPSKVAAGQQDTVGHGWRWVPQHPGVLRAGCCRGGRRGPFKRGGGRTMAIITLALEVTPVPLRFHLGRGGGDGPLPGGGGEPSPAEPGGEGRPGPTRPGAARGRPLPRVTAGLAPGPRRRLRAASCRRP